MILTLSTISELERLYGEATKVRLGEWRYRPPSGQHEERYELIGDPCGFPVAIFGHASDAGLDLAAREHMPALLASARYVHELAAMGSSGCSTDLAAVLERARQIVGDVK